jgi:uncharacterized membrane protein YesL
MGLFGNHYEQTGPGIAKGAPRKKGFARYMELFLAKFWKLIELNLFYTLFFIPLIVAGISFFLMLSGSLASNLAIVLMIAGVLLFVVLFGPATAGLMKIMRNFVIEKPTFMIHDFMKTFRAEFAHSFVVGFLDCLMACCVAAAFYVYPKLAEQSGNKIFYLMLVITLSISLVVILMNFYVFLMMVSTNLSLKNVLKNSLFLGIVCMKKNVITLGILAVVVGGILLLLTRTNLMIIFIVLTFLPFIPATFLALMVALNSYPAIQKYIINPYYEKLGQINPELEPFQTEKADKGDTVFEDMGGQEKPTKMPRETTRTTKDPAKQHKGKIIS